MPCLRRATALAYTDADEDAERLLSFGDLSSTGNEADEWVETHAGRVSAHDSVANPANIDEIPDVDEAAGEDAVASALGNMSLSGANGGSAADIPDMDEIPDMEEEGLEAGEDEATAAPKASALTARTIDARCVRRTGYHECAYASYTAKSRWRKATYYKYEPMT